MPELPLTPPPDQRRARCRSRAALAAVAALALVVAPARAADMAAAVEAYQKRDFATALAELAPLAEAGDPRAQTIIGIMHEGGEGVPVDHAAAARWFRLAAEQGYDPAQYSLANLYATGRGVPRDEREASFWFASAAAQGNRWALRRMEGEGEGEPTRSLVERPGREPIRAAATGIAPERLSGLMGRFPALAAEPAPQAVPAALEGTGGETPRLAGEVPVVSAAATTPAPREGVAEPAPAARLGQLDHGPMTEQPEPGRAAAPPEAREAAPGDPVPPRAGRYRVQIASMRSHELAQRALARVASVLDGADAGLEPTVARADLGGSRGIWFRGQLGPVGSVAEAKRLCARIIERGGAPHCLPINEPTE